MSTYGQMVDADTIVTAGNSMLSVPIKVQGYQGQTSFEMSIRFDPSQVAYDSVLTWHPQLQASVLGVRDDSIAWGKIVVAAIDSTGVPNTIPDDEALFHIRFWVTGSSPLVIDSVLFLQISNDSIVETNPVVDDGRIEVSSSLPIELRNFWAECKRNVVLSWITETEQNSDFFVIERSYDAVLFDKIGTINASGMSIVQQHYTFTDPMLRPEQQIYYRLKMVDKDKTYKYSKVIAHTCGHQQSDKAMLIPNPQKVNQPITLSSLVFDKGVVRVFDEQGRKIYQKDFSQAGVTNVLIPGIATPGVYMVVCEYSSTPLMQSMKCVITD